MPAAGSEPCKRTAPPMPKGLPERLAAGGLRARSTAPVNSPMASPPAPPAYQLQTWPFENLEKTWSRWVVKNRRTPAFRLNTEKSRQARLVYDRAIAPVGGVERDIRHVDGVATLPLHAEFEPVRKHRGLQKATGRPVARRRHHGPAGSTAGKT